METTVSMLVDYEGSHSRRVAGDVWSGFSRAALDGGAGYTKTTAVWDSLRAPVNVDSSEAAVQVLVLDQELPEAVDFLENLSGGVPLYGLVLAVPDCPNPLGGSLLYQGVERLKERGVKPGCIEPALLRADPGECERYAGRILERLKVH